MLDFKQIFLEWKVSKTGVEYKLPGPAEFKKVKRVDFTLSWPNIKQEVCGLDDKKLILPYQIGADTLYELSKPDEKRETLVPGSLIRKERIKAGLTQGEPGARIGSDKTYISKVESNQFQIEISTLRKIVEGGLNKRLLIRVHSNTYNHHPINT